MTRLQNINIPSFDKFIIGFDQLFDELDMVSTRQAGQTYPPHNVIQSGDSTKLELAVAGFKESEITIDFKDKRLTISGKREKVEQDDSIVYRHKGISSRDFTLTFRIAEYAEVEDATLENGILTISLMTRIPEEMQPKRIAITSK